MNGRTALVKPLALVALTFASAHRPAAADDFTLPFQVSDRAVGIRLLLDYEHNAAAGSWTVAADRLQQLLDLPAETAVVIRAKGVWPARFEGSGVVARRLFDALPDDGRKAWEANSRQRAEELLGRGLRLRREQDLREAARRYPAPDVRRRAYDALAQLALVRSDLAAAQFHLKSLADAVEPADLPEVLARLAWVSAQVGDAERVAELRKLAEAHRDARVTAGAGTEPLPAFVDRMARVAAAAAAASRPRQFGEDWHGSGVSDPPPAPEQIRWSVATEFERGAENDDENSPFTSRRDQERQSPVVPVIAHGLVFVNNGLTLTALNLTSGTPAWRRIGTQAPHGADWRESFVSTHTVAVADGAVYAALAVRSEVGARPDRTFYGKTILYPLPHRCLVALDERTGDVIWSHEASALAEGREDAKEVAHECVSSPPLVVGDDLIVASWTYDGIFDVRLVCYDRHTGATRWRRSIVQGQQELNLFGRPVKELTTSALAESDGRVFFATGLGIAAAVEREDGRIAWLTAYRQTAIPRAEKWYETKDREISWWPSPVSASQDAVLMAPCDAHELFCFDPDTGVMRWTRSRFEGRHSYRWFLGASGGRAYVAGTRAMAFDIANKGVNAWNDAEAGSLAAPKLAPSEAAGRAILTKDRIYVPTERSIAVISTLTGQPESPWSLATWAKNVGPVTGNLVSADGALLFATRNSIQASYRFEGIRAQIEARLAQDPDDPQARLDAGEAYAASGRLDTAIEMLEGGFKRLPHVPPRARDRIETSLRHALYTVHLARAEMRREAKDPAAAAEDLRAAAAVARDKGDAVRALLALAEALTEGGRRADAEAALQRIATEFGEVVTITEDGERAHAGPLALDRLAQSHFDAGKTAEAVSRWLDLLEAYGREDLGATVVSTAVRQRLAEVAKTDAPLVASAVRARAKRAFDTAKAAGDVKLLERAQLYPDAEYAAESALLAADLHLAANRPRDAVSALSALLSDAQTQAVRARALWRLASAYRAMGETARERVQLRALAADAPLELVDGKRTAADAAKEELAAPRFRNTAVAMSDPRPPLTLLWQEGGSDQLPPQVLRLAGTPPPEMDGRMVLTIAGVVKLVDEATGAVLWQQATRVDVRAAAAVPGAIVLAGSDSSSSDRAVVVMALSIADGREVWPRKRFPGQYKSAETTLGVLYAVFADASAPSGRPSHTMAAVSLGSGDVIALRSFGGVLRPQIAAAEDAIVVTEPTRSRDAARRALVTLDGTTLALRGRVELTAPSAPFCVHPPLSQVVVTDDAGALVAVDVSTGELAWKQTLGAGRAVKAVFALPGALFVSDDADALHRIGADDGREGWTTSLAASGNLVFQGEAAEGDLVVATVKPKQGASTIAVALDAATGAERWRRTIELADENSYPHPEILGSVVAYELNERLERGTRSRVILLDRATGAVVQEIEHGTIGKTYQRVVYGPDWIAVSSANELAVYGRPGNAK